MHIQPRALNILQMCAFGFVGTILGIALLEFAKNHGVATSVDASLLSFFNTSAGTGA